MFVRQTKGERRPNIEILHRMLQTIKSDFSENFSAEVIKECEAKIAAHKKDETSYPAVESEELNFSEVISEMKLDTIELDKDVRKASLNIGEERNDSQQGLL